MATYKRPAYSITKLRDQINAKYPNRSKASDGILGDTAHASRPSDHNPDANGIVRAIDITHDPANGVDIAKIFDGIKGDSRVKYLIYNRRIYEGGSWKSYSGSNPHTKHGHVSVNGNYDNNSNWNIGEDMYQGKTAEQWAKERDAVANIAEARRTFLGKLESAAGVDTGKVDPDKGVDQAIALIDAKNKLIAKLEAGQKITPKELEDIKKTIDEAYNN